MYFSIDRVVGKTAHLIGEDQKPLDVPVAMLPAGAKNGDMVRFKDGVFLCAPQKTEERRAHMADMLETLLKRGDEEH